MTSLKNQGKISLEGVRVHNLKSICLDIPYNQLTVLCGLSGSGKSSLAMDMLYAEGQRRYIESFSAYTRQFLERLEKPDVDRVEGILPAIAVTSKPTIQMNRSTVGTATETADYLRLLFSKIGNVYCESCSRPVKSDTPDSILQMSKNLPEGAKVYIAFSPSIESFRMKKNEFEKEWRDAGFQRVVVDHQIFRLDNGGIPLDKYISAQFLFLADQADSPRSMPSETAFVEGELFSPQSAANLNSAQYLDSDINSEQLSSLENNSSSEQISTTDSSNSLIADLTPKNFLADKHKLESESKIETVSGLKKENESESEFETGSKTDLETESKKELETENKTDAESDNESDSESDADLNSKMLSQILLPGADNDSQLEVLLQRYQMAKKRGGLPPLFFIVDRIVIGKTTPERIRESLETAMSFGDNRCWIFHDQPDRISELAKKAEERRQSEQNNFVDQAEQNSSSEQNSSDISVSTSKIQKTVQISTSFEQNSQQISNEKNFQINPSPRIGKVYELEDERWQLVGFSQRLTCEDCGIEYPRIEPKLFSFNSPLGACPLCEGFGNLMTFDLNLIVPNKFKSIREGAIAPWNSPAYRYKLAELSQKAEELGIPLDIPFKNLTAQQLDRVLNGSERLKYDGLNGFFKKLQKQKYKMHIRVFLSRWRSYRVCPLCQGARLRPEALAVRIQGKNIHELSSMRIADVLDFLESWQLSDWERQVGTVALQQVLNRLKFLKQVGLGYLSLDRMMKTLSSGEQRRIGLTSVLGSTLVDMLYVLDEPSIGLHPADTQSLIKSIRQLKDRGNTVVVVEHEEEILEAADRIVEIGPEAGQNGGRIVFEGTVDELKQSPTSLTGSYLSGRRSNRFNSQRRILEHGFLELTGAKGNNLKNIDVVFPLGILCLITGVSGSGKSTLVQETLYPAICQKMKKDNAQAGCPFDRLLGVGQIDDVIMIDQNPIGRSPRSNPVTYLKIFDEIRSVFAETVDAKARGYGAGYFSFNVDGGRCNTCKGEGFIAIDMQFMADMFVRCPQCGGHRYQQEILDIQYRGKNIAEVLDMTVREAFGFFRGQAKVQQKLKQLIDVGLDYVRLGQPANTLSGGESQRLKLAAYLSNAKKERCLFLLDEPTTGLHFADVVQLLDGFDALLQTGHSLIVVEHNLQMIKAADYIIDLGPGAGEEGGQIVAQGTPEQVARCSESKTGQYLAKHL